MVEPKSKKAKATKQKIVNAAKKLLLENDVTKTSVNRIVREAGVAKGTFYLYFETKENLVWEIVNNNLKELGIIIKRLEDMPVSEETIDLLIDYSINVINENMSLMKLLHQAKTLDYLGLQKDKNIIEFEFQKSIKTWLDNGVKQNLINIPDTNFYACYLWTSIHELFDRFFMGSIDFPLEEMSIHFKVILKKILFTR